jgi:hypothetical protein
MPTRPLRISPNGRYFVRDGEPFFWLGDTQWELFRSFTMEDAGAVLEHRKRQGFSVIQIMFTGVGDGSKPNLAGQTPWINNDPATPNEAYFQQVDAIIALARALDLILVVGAFHQLQVNRITPANARDYAKWIARRYRHEPHLVWASYPKADPEYVPVLRELAAGFQEGDDGVHPITIHPDPSPASSSFVHTESWLAFNMMQPWHRYELIPPMVAHDYALEPTKPAVMAEAGYEGVKSRGLDNPWTIRKQAYWSHLAGGHHSYGNENNYVSPTTWRDWIESPGACHMSLYRQILTAIPEWWNLTPDPSILTDGAGEGAEANLAARSASGDWVLVYLSTPSTVAVRMSAVSTASTVEVSWVNPTNAVRTPVGATSSAGVRAFTTPDGWEDALLYIEARA